MTPLPIFRTASDRVLYTEKLRVQVEQGKAEIARIVAESQARRIPWKDYVESVNQAARSVGEACEQFFALTGKLL